MCEFSGSQKVTKHVDAKVKARQAALNMSGGVKVSTQHRLHLISHCVCVCVLLCSAGLIVPGNDAATSRPPFAPLTLDTICSLRPTAWCWVGGGSWSVLIRQLVVGIFITVRKPISIPPFPLFQPIHAPFWSNARKLTHPTA